MKEKANKSGLQNHKRGIRVCDCRKEKGYTQEELAKASDYTKQYISAVENGRRPLTVEAAHILAPLLGVRMEFLLCEDDFKTTADVALFENNTIAQAVALRDALEYCHIDTNITTTADKADLVDTSGKSPEIFRFYTEDVIDFFDEVLEYIAFKFKRMKQKSLEMTDEQIEAAKEMYTLNAALNRLIESNKQP